MRTQTQAQAERAIQSFEDQRLARYLDSLDDPPERDEPEAPRDCPGWDLGECWGCPHEEFCFGE